MLLKRSETRRTANDRHLIMSTFPMKCLPPNVDVPNKTGSPISIMLNYSGRQCCSMFVGMIALLAGSGSNFAVPALIGFVVDAMKKDPVDWDSINFYCFWTDRWLLSLYSLRSQSGLEEQHSTP